MQAVRAKFRCNSVETFVPVDVFAGRVAGAGLAHDAGTEGTRVYRFAAQYDPSVPEDQRYAKYTPSGELRISVDNPAVLFEPGRQYYLDFTLAEEG